MCYIGILIFYLFERNFKIIKFAISDYNEWLVYHNQLSSLVACELCKELDCYKNGRQVRLG